jgi:hypothetical protein
VAWYPFNGDADDYAGLNFNGNALDVNYTENRFNQQDQAIELNGYSSLVELYSLNSFIAVDPIMSSYTVSLWFKFEYGQAWQTIFSDYAGLYPSSDPTFSTLVELERYPNVDDEYRLTIQGRHEQSSVGIDLGEVSPNGIWHNLTFSINPDLEMITAFFDGEFFEAPWLSSVQFDYETSSENLFIGKRNNWLEDQYFKGVIDEFGIWNRALSAEEMTGIYLSAQPVYGCTDSLANNFNSEATLDDGTCCYVNITQNDTTICEGDSISLSGYGLSAVNWTEIYLEDFEDGQAQGWYFVDGGCGGQDVFNVNGNNVWRMTSDWNTFRKTINGYPDPVGLALEFKAKRISGTWGVGFRNNVAAWNYNTSDGYGFRYNPTDNTHNYINSVVQSSYPQVTINDWHTYRIEEVGADCMFYIDGILVFSQENVDQSLMGSYMSFSANGIVNCINPHRVYYDDIRIEKASEIYSNITWSTGDTTASITVTPTQTTTYWVEQTENGVTCTDEVTITVQSTGCGNSDACNFTEGDACDIDCVFALFENDCNTGAVACGEGTVWDADTQECIVAYPSDSNFDSCVDLNDLMDLLSSYGICLDPE